MYSVTVRDHIMVSHSLPDPFFGPAQNMHGATFVIDVTFFSDQLNPQNVVVDIGLAHHILKRLVDELNYQNLDELDKFKGQLTTTEFLAAYIHRQIKQHIAETFQGKIKVTLGESHVAWASYED